MASQIWELYRNGRRFMLCRRGYRGRLERGTNLEAVIEVPVSGVAGDDNQRIEDMRDALTSFPPRGPDRLPLVGPLDEVLAKLRDEEVSARA